MNASNIRFPATPAQIDATRANLLKGLRDRGVFEASRTVTNEKEEKEITSILDYLARQEKKAEKIDAMTLAYAAAHAFDYDVHINSVRQEGKRCNVYAIPKWYVIQRVLNGARFQAASDDRTVAATVLALGSGITHGKSIWDAVNERCSAWGMGGGKYASGQTQGISSLRALDALGITAPASSVVREVANKEHFAFLLKAAKQFDKNKGE
jgi:hypothetical protein